MKYCRFCGKPLQDMSTFCPHCMRKQQESVLAANVPEPRPHTSYKRLILLAVSFPALAGLAALILLCVKAEPFVPSADWPPLSSVAAEAVSPASAKNEEESSIPLSDLPASSAAVREPDSSQAAPSQPDENPHDMDPIVDGVWGNLRQLKGEFVFAEDTTGLRCTTLSVSVKSGMARAVKEITARVTTDSGYATWENAYETLPENQWIAPFRRLCRLEPAGMSPDGLTWYIRWYDGIPTETAPAPVLPERDIQELLLTAETAAGAAGLAHRSLYNEGIDGAFFCLPRSPAAEGGSIAYIEPADWDEYLAGYWQHLYTLGYTAYDLRFFYTTEEQVVFFLYIK